MKQEYDFNKGKRGAVVTAPTGKTRVTIRLDDDLLNWFRDEVDRMGGGNYQSAHRNIGPPRPLVTALKAGN